MAKPFGLRTSKIPMRDDEGKVFGILGTYEDITDRKRLELKLVDKAEELKILNTNLERINTELEYKNHQLEEFTYIMTHDLQEPLRTIMSFSQLLRKSKNLDDAQQRMTQYVHDSAKRLSLLVKNVMDYLIIGKRESVNTHDLNELVANVLADLADSIKITNAKVTYDKLPIATVYNIEFRQLIQNLIANSIKFSQSDAPPVIHISYHDIGEYHQFSVTDNGIGIDLEHSGRIFRVFQRLHNRTVYEGTGIGLANCRKIATLHGGNINLDSGYENGSKFIFTIRKNIGFEKN